MACRSVAIKKSIGRQLIGVELAVGFSGGMGVDPIDPDSIVMHGVRASPTVTIRPAGREQELSVIAAPTTGDAGLGGGEEHGIAGELDIR